MSIIGHIKDNNESANRTEVRELKGWCRAHNLFLNVYKEVVIGIRRSCTQEHIPLYIDGTAVERVISVKYLVVHIADDLTPGSNTAAVTKKAQQ